MKRHGTVEVDGDRVRYLREEVFGWSQEELALECVSVSERTGGKLCCCRGTIQNVESGRPAYAATVHCLAEALHVSFQSLLRRKSQKRRRGKKALEMKPTIETVSQVLQTLTTIEGAVNELLKRIPASPVAGYSESYSVSNSKTHGFTSGNVTFP